jgi:hypothetical protein
MTNSIGMIWQRVLLSYGKCGGQSLLLWFSIVKQEDALPCEKKSPFDCHNGWLIHFLVRPTIHLSSPAHSVRLERPFNDILTFRD